MDQIDEWMKRLDKVTSISEPTEQSPNKKGTFFKKKGVNPKGQKPNDFKKQSHKKPGEAKKKFFNKKPTEAKKQFGNKPMVPKKPFNKKAEPYKKRAGNKSILEKRISKKHAPSKKPRNILRNTVKIIPLGGLDEVGKNMMALEYENDIIIIDMGFEFPSDDLLGIDYVIPDVSYLEENKDRIRGVVITHGHLDHIGGVPYILPKLDYPPIYSLPLTLGLISKRGEEFKQGKLMKLHSVKPGEKIRLGNFTCNFFRVAHSIPDATGVCIDTPVGRIVHTGDFKFDETPARNMQKVDVSKIAEIGKQGVLALLCESTNALKPGHSMSEKDVGHALEDVIGNIKGRIIISSFSSQIGRIQQIFDAAVKANRKIFVGGRSMITNIKIAAKLGYLKFPNGLIQELKKYKKEHDHETLILTTGSQGEAVAALSRMARQEHAHIKVKKGDTIVLSSSPIPGNEQAINTVINKLTILGADVIHNQMADIHTSGHGKQEELSRMIDLIKPKYLIPVHGEFYMRKGLAKLAQENCNIPEQNIIMLENGDVLLVEKGNVKKSKEKIETKYILIDGRGEGTLDSQVQVDREIMSRNGALIILVHISKRTKKLRKIPDVVSRGFIYRNESDEIIQEISKIAGDAYKKIHEKNPGAKRRDVKQYIKQTIDKYTHREIERRPLIIPLIIED